MPNAVLSGPWDEMIAALYETAKKLEEGFGGEGGPLDRVGEVFRNEMRWQFNTGGTRLDDAEWAPVGDDPDPKEAQKYPAEYRRQHWQVPLQEVDTQHYTQDSEFDPVNDPLRWTGDLMNSLTTAGAPGNINELNPYEAIFGSDIAYADNAEFGGPGDWWERMPRPIMRQKEDHDKVLPKLESALLDEFAESIKDFLPIFGVSA